VIQASCQGDRGRGVAPSEFQLQAIIHEGPASILKSRSGDVRPHRIALRDRLYIFRPFPSGFERSAFYRGIADPHHLEFPLVERTRLVGRSETLTLDLLRNRCHRLALVGSPKNANRIEVGRGELMPIADMNVRGRGRVFCPRIMSHVRGRNPVAKCLRCDGT
jgi:hypothetical protein